MTGQLNPDADATGRSQTRNNTASRRFEITPSPSVTHPTPLEAPSVQATPPHNNNQSHNSPPAQYGHNIPSRHNRCPDYAHSHSSPNTQDEMIQPLNVKDTRLSEELRRIMQRLPAEMNPPQTASVAEIRTLQVQGNLRHVMNNNNALTEELKMLGDSCEKYNREVEDWRRQHDEWKRSCEELQRRINAYENPGELLPLSPSRQGSPLPHHGSPGSSSPGSPSSEVAGLEEKN